MPFCSALPAGRLKHTLDKKSKSLGLRRRGIVGMLRLRSEVASRSHCSAQHDSRTRSDWRTFVIGDVPLELGSPFVGPTPDLRPGLLYAAPSAPLRAGSTGPGWGGAGCVFSSRNIATNFVAPRNPYARRESKSRAACAGNSSWCRWRWVLAWGPSSGKERPPQDDRFA
jgi:hypothetical protein